MKLQSLTKNFSQSDLCCDLWQLWSFAVVSAKGGLCSSDVSYKRCSFGWDFHWAKQQPSYCHYLTAFIGLYTDEAPLQRLWRVLNSMHIQWDLQQCLLMGTCTVYQARVHTADNFRFSFLFSYLQYTGQHYSEQSLSNQILSPDSTNLTSNTTTFKLTEDSVIPLIKNILVLTEKRKAKAFTETTEVKVTHRQESVGRKS